MSGVTLLPSGLAATPEMDRLRTRAQDLANARDWAGLHALRAELERDRDFWPDIWGPWCAVAARKLGDPGAADLLSELVRAGFCQPQLVDGELESAFGDDPAWPQIRERMARNVPPPPLALTEWPVITPAAPLELFDLPGRAAELRALVPPPLDSAWATAVATLDWVTHRWKHANAHMEIDDAVECLRRVDAGQRFACVEYSLVLSQALNTLGIPARRLTLYQANYHVGVARSHMVSEAWIDDLGRWVVLDGQNGLYWTAEDGQPLGAPVLQRAVRSGASCPRHVTARDDVSSADAELWFSHFHDISGSAGTWSPGPFGLVFQRNRLAISRRLEYSAERFYPDLSEIGVQTALAGDQPALRLTAAHPYARGFLADCGPLPDDLLPLDQSPGDHEVMLAVRTDYGALAGRPLRYRIEP
jgi:Transglutaminase-like superfamily